MASINDSQQKPTEEHEDYQLLLALQGQLHELQSEHREKMRESALELEKSMCDKFRMLREERGWSQHDISEKLGQMGIEMHQTTVAKMEKGKRPLRVAEMYALSWVFGLPPGAVFWIPEREKLPYSMQYVTERLASINEQQNDMRETFLKMLESHVSFYSDLGSERASLVRAMNEASRAAANTDELTGMEVPDGIDPEA